MALYTYRIDHETFEEVSREWIYKYFKGKEFISVDTETFGFDCHTKELMCVQIGDYYDQFVIHPDVIGEFKKLLEEKTLILHNAKFDLKFLYKKDIWPNRVYDTMLAEQVIHCGNPTVRHNLAAVAKRRLDIDLDKSVRDNIWREGLTERVIQYAGDDVKHLEGIMDKQQGDLDRLNLQKVVQLENDFTLVLAYIEYCGFKLDREKWQAKMDKDLKALREAEAFLNNFIWENDIKGYKDTQLDMFSEHQNTLINWGSPKQVVKLFKKLGIPCTITEKGKTKDSVEASVIGKYKGQFPIVKHYLDYKEKEKVVGTYGQSFLDQINPVTGRLHTNFKQILDTGRISSGGKNRSTKEEYLNFQNIPSDKETRACFVAEPGNSLVICDYSGQEQIVLANYSLDENLLKFYDEGLADMHSYVASLIYPELQGLSLDDIKIHHKDKRQKSKSVGFTVNYGGNELTIADDLGIPVEEAKPIYDGYFIAFPGLDGYFKKAKKQGLEKGYILIDKVIGRKSFIYGYEEYRRLRKEMGERFWDNWKLLKKLKKQAEEAGEPMSPSDYHLYQTYRDKISRYFKIKGEIERKSLNFPIQGSSANITKKSAILFFRWIKDNDLLNTVLFCNQVHDENVVECPVDIKERVGEALTDCMNKAGAIYCKRVPLKTEPDYSPFWRK